MEKEVALGAIRVWLRKLSETSDWIPEGLSDNYADHVVFYEGRDYLVWRNDTKFKVLDVTPPSLVELIGRVIAVDPPRRSNPWVNLLYTGGYLQTRGVPFDKWATS